MKNVFKFIRLRSKERALILQSFYVLPLISLALHLIGFRRLRLLLDRIHSIQPRENAVSLSEALSIARMVKVASYRGFYRANCLQQSLAILWFLRRRGIAADLRIGVRRENDRFEAHAWVEYFETILNDSDNVRKRYFSFDRSILSLSGGLS